MARGFGATSGVGATDKIVSAYATMPTTWTMAWWHVQNGQGGSTFGRPWHQDTGNSLYNNANTGNLNLDIDWSGTDGRWSITRPSLSDWHHIVITYDASNAANDPIIYVDGASVTVTRSTSPTGAYVTPSAALTIGNDPTGVANWDGQLAEFAVWSRILTADEAAALGKGYSPLFLRQSLVEYVPMLRDNVSRILAAPAVTGTAVTAHPRAIYPVSAWRIIAPDADSVAPQMWLTRPAWYQR